MKQVSVKLSPEIYQHHFKIDPSNTLVLYIHVTIISLNYSKQALVTSYTGGTWGQNITVISVLKFHDHWHIES